MTFDALESSRHGGQPLNLALFQTETRQFAYCDSTKAQVYSHGGAPVTYQPLTFARGAHRISGTLDGSTLQFDLPSDSAVAGLFRGTPPSFIVTLTLRQTHVGEPEAPVSWIGRVLGGTFDRANVCRLACQPYHTSIRRQGLRAKYQYGCRHVLYSDVPGACRADKAAATIVVAATSATGNLVVLPAAWFGSIPAIKYVGGLAQWTDNNGETVLRSILAVESNGKDLRLAGEATDLSASDPVSLSLGCNHNEDDCANLHVETGTGNPNIINYGGQPWIPLKNPVGSNSIYY